MKESLGLPGLFLFLTTGPYMKNLIIALFLVVPLAGIAQSITGKWKTLDDNTGEEKSIVEISEKGGKYYGKVIKIFRDQGEDPDPLCDECAKDDPRYKKKIIGLEIIQNMKKSGDEY